MFSVDRLHWLTGLWIAEYEGRKSEEFWLPPMDGQMIGISRTSREGKILFEEQMRIGRWHGADAFVVIHKLGDPAEMLILIEESDDHVLFKDPADPEGIRVGYYRTEEGMEARVFGIKKSRKMDLRFSFMRPLGSSR